ncbi:MAG TPA: alpha-amylase family glycosyl hydrolase [Aggregatilineaceae bacterium]|nr:alpha-amylase family glycosyl hydrolase [Aggregatilineaceae bacterium]
MTILTGKTTTPPKPPIQDLIIYEMHVRGFTRHASARAKHPGTFAAIRDKIPYLLELGVNCVELLPIFEFDEFEYYHRSPEGHPLMNYWGYSTLGFFAPKAGLAATGTLGMQVDELKALIKVLHQYGIEVILDVVFNHTAEGDHRGKTISYRGIDNKTYYMLTPDGYYFNFSGTGNTLNCNHPVVRGMVLDCLRYWAAEYHIDGFRFDLASILGRDQDGTPLANPPLLETMAYDPILAKCKLIAEAWDAGGLYQVGSFPAYGRWAEWNGQYRDTLRRFLKSDEGQVPAMAQRIQGSPDLYKQRGPVASVNFITCHDGFTLHDLVAYNTKHNEANGENNWDGNNDNLSWNCGVEGPTADPAVLELRRRQQKNAIAMLMVSQGIPMILMGDEIARTQQGNNNTYCQDNDLSWLDWTLLETNYDQFRFFSNMIAFRKAHPLLRQPDFLNGRDAEITWHSTQAFNADWSYYSRVLAFMLSSRTNPEIDQTIYVAMNMYWKELAFELPQIGVRWYSFANTGHPTPTDIYEPGYEPLLDDQRTFVLGPRSVAIMVGR